MWVNSTAIWRSLILVVFALSWLGEIVEAIYGEQLGEFDWKRENIGLIEQSLYFPTTDTLVVASAEGVLAGLDETNGVAKWRVVLPVGAIVERIVEADRGTVVTVSSGVFDDSNNDNHATVTVLVHLWNSQTGALLWDTSLGSVDARSHQSGMYGFDVLYTDSQHLLTVLCGNALHFVKPRTRLAPASYWRWSPDDNDADRAAATTTKKDSSSRLILSSLIVPTSFDSGGGSSSNPPASPPTVRTAVGCFASPSSSSSSSSSASSGVVTCDGAVVVVNAHHATSSVQVDSFGALTVGHGLAPRDLVGIVSSDARVDYLPYDVVFGSTTTASTTAATVVMTVLDLSSNKVQSVRTPTTTTTTTTATVVNVDSFIYVASEESDVGGGGTDLRPACTVCTVDVDASSGSAAVNAAAGTVCRSYMLALPSASTSSGRSSSSAAWTLSDIAVRSASAVGQERQQQHLSLETLVKRDSLRYYDGLAQGLYYVHLASSSSSASAESVIDAVEVQALAEGGIAAAAATTIRFDGLSAPVQPFQMPPASRLLAATSTSASASAMTRGGGGVGGGGGGGGVHHISIMHRHSYSAVRLLLVLHSGLTLCLQASSSSSSSGGGSSGGGEVLWTREEALASTQQAVLVEGADGGSSSSSSGGGGTATGASVAESSSSRHALLGFTQRLEMQGLKFAGYFTSMSKAFSRLPAWALRMARTYSGYLTPSSSTTKTTRSTADSSIDKNERNFGKLQMFGFDKLAICLCYSKKLARLLSVVEEGTGSISSSGSGSGATSAGVRMSEAGLQVVGVDLLRAHDSVPSTNTDTAVQWTSYLSLGGGGALQAAAAEENGGAAAGVEEDPVIVFVKLVGGTGNEGTGLADGSSTSTSTSAAAPATPNSHSSSKSTSSSGGGGGVESVSAATVTVVVGTRDGRTLLWHLRAENGRSVGSRPLGAGGAGGGADDTCANSVSGGGVDSTCASGTAFGVVVAYPTAQIQALQSGTMKSRWEGGGGPALITSSPVAPYAILHEASTNDSSRHLLVTHLHTSSGIQTDAAAGSSSSSSYYVHKLDRASQQMVIYKVVVSAAAAAAVGTGAEDCAAQLRYTYSHTSSAHLHGMGLRMTCAYATAVASVAFDSGSSSAGSSSSSGGERERIVGVAYPNHRAAVHSRYSVLGDDSVLVKYLNPNLALITTIVPGNTMHWTLVDVVTGKVITRQQQEDAALPAHAVVVENHIVATYWNTKAKRAELSSTALYEGVIDNYELSPFASSRARSGSIVLSMTMDPTTGAPVTNRSAYATFSPIAMQKTYVLPHAVTALSHTVTAHGIAHKHILVSLRNGQIYSLDMRQIHPRRPFSDPSAAEKTEGLAKYTPFLQLNPLAAVTHNYSLPGGASNILSAESNLESSSLVFAFGGGRGGVDLMVNRVMPSQEFDLLASDFNHSLLITILLGLAAAVLVLRRLQQRKHLSSVWA